MGRILKYIFIALLTLAVLFGGLVAYFFFAIDDYVDDIDYENIEDIDLDNIDPETIDKYRQMLDDYEVEDEADYEDEEYEQLNLTGQNLSLYENEGLRKKRDYSNAQTVTILCYMNGSDLESESGEATEDICEMIAAPYNENVNIILQTMGTKSWSKKLGISSDHSQRFRVVEDGIELLDDSLLQLDCTKEETLEDFIKWGVAEYPADRYILHFWDHGAGPVYGFGYDETNGEENSSLTIDKMQQALRNSGVFFDIIGMDCCIMSSIEICMALYDFCDYMILSEDFESGLGWSYKGWITMLSKNPARDSRSVGKRAIDDFVRANEEDFESGSASIMAIIDESVVNVLFRTWVSFAYANETELLENNYSHEVVSKKGGRVHPILKNKARKSNGTRPSIWDILFSDDTSLSDYYVTDLMAVAQNIKSEQSAALSSAIYNSIVYCNQTSDEKNLTGLSVTLPYGDAEFYYALYEVFGNCGIDKDYVGWLERFAAQQGDFEYYDYEDWDSVFDWDDYDDSYDWDEWELWDEWAEYACY